MSTTRTLLCLILTGSIGILTAAEGHDPLKKPEAAAPTPLKILENDPNYKRAPLLILPGAPLDKNPVSPGGLPANQTAWHWHKNAMHLKAVKRSGQDHPDLAATVRELTDNAGVVDEGLDEPESAFETFVPNPDKPGETLAIFRFTNLREFLNDGNSNPNNAVDLLNPAVDPGKRRAALAAAVALGKAFFWDPRFSSDGKVSCASCHYAAGADQRTRGVVTFPANLGIRAPWPDPRSTNGYKPYDLTVADLVSGSPEIEGRFAPGLFDPRSLADFQVREVIGSLGVKRRYFDKDKDGTLTPDPAATPSNEDPFASLLNRFSDIESTYRQVTPRNAGTVINAVFNSRNFHDSRASMVFNGHSGFGQHTDDLINNSLFVLRENGGKLDQIHTWNPANPDGTTRNPYYIANASLASQAVEPILSDVEMSSSGRAFHHIAKRLLDQPILQGADISPDDSSLGQYAAPQGDGKRITYRKLIEAAFDEAWWKSKTKVKRLSTAVTTKDGKSPRQRGPNGLNPTNDDRFYADSELADYDLTEANFGLFWGLAIHLYESTLISDQSPFDIEQRNVKQSARAKLTAAATLDGQALRAVQPLNASARRGFEIFRTAGCAECHTGSEFTGIGISEIGLLRAIGFNRDGTPNPALPPTDIFAPLPPDPADTAEDDIVAGILLCPPEKPLGVECMDMGGRMDSVYDGGNYNIGISRFIRLPGWPDAPPVIGASNLKPIIYPRQTVLWEDSGNGNTYHPNEPGVLPDKPLGATIRSLFGAHLGSNPAALQRFHELLKLGTTDATFSNTGSPPNTNAASFDPSILRTLNLSDRDLKSIIAQSAAGIEEGRRSFQALQENLTVLGAQDTSRKAALDQISKDIDTVQTTARQAGQTIAAQARPALNNTQQYKRLDRPANAVLSKLAVPTNNTELPTKTLLAAQLSPADLAALAERQLTLSVASDGTVSTLVTASTTPPPHSLARRWFERLNQIIIAAEAELRQAQQNGNAPMIAHYTRLIDSLRRLQRDDERIADAGAFKAPSLRNIELTGPYMHNGSLLTLEAVVDFYSRGGDYNRRVRSNEEAIKTGDLHPAMEPLNLSTEQKADLVSFLHSLTDPRVTKQQAPFDHPSLEIPASSDFNTTISTIKIPSTGRNGGAKVGSFEKAMLMQ